MKYRRAVLLSCCLYLIYAIGTAGFAQELSQNPTETTIRALAVDKREPVTLYAGTEQGMFLSRDDGQSWTATGLDDQTIKAIVVHPSDRDIIFAAAGEAGVFRSSDGGREWESLPVTQAVAAPPGQTRVSDPEDIRSLAVFLNDGLVLLAGSYRGYIFKSTDGGDSWRVINPDFPLPVLNALSVHPANPELTYAASGARGILVSNNNTEWKPMNTGLINTTVTQVVIDPANPDIIYAGTYGGGVYRSVDAGRNWSSFNNGLTSNYILSLAVMAEPTGGGRRGFLGEISNGIKKLMFDPAASDIYAGVYGGGLFKSRVGAQWSRVSPP